MLVGTPGRNAQCDALVEKLNDGAGPGYVEIWTTGKGTLLATLTFNDPAFGAAVAGVATANAITGDSSADATGVAAEFQTYDSDANEIWSGDVGTSGADMNLDNVNIVIGATVNLTAWTVTQPA